MMPDLTKELTDSQKVAVNQLTLNTALNDTQADVKELQKIVIFGNGELPLREQVRNHETFIKDIKYWVRFVGGAIVLQTLAFAIGILVALIKFLPVLEQIAKEGSH